MSNRLGTQVCIEETVPKIEQNRIYNGLGLLSLFVGA